MVSDLHPSSATTERRRFLALAKRGAGDYLKFLAVASRLLISVKELALRSRYRRQLWSILRARGLEPQILLIYAIKIAMHYYYAAITKALGEADRADGVMPDAMRSFSRAEHVGSGGRPQLGDAGAEQIVDVDDADRAPVLDHEQCCDAR